jgi:hypothetical protein
MQVSLDGGITYVDALEGVRVIHFDENVNGIPQELHVNLTEEGIIMDVWREDEIFGTSSETFADIIDSLVG